VCILFGPPLHVPRDADAAALETLRARLETELHRLDAEAAERL
jgi:hypothetical protein